MKTYSWLVLAMALCSPGLTAQISIPSATAGPVIVETGPHHRLWQTVTIDVLGNHVTNSYTELATGMYFWNSAAGKYEPSKEQFQIVADGSAIATNASTR